MRGGLKARGVTDDAIDVADGTAAAAHDVVVVVADPALLPRRAAGLLYPADQAGRGQRVQRLVHRLGGDMPDPVPDAACDLVRAGVAPGRDGLQDRQPGRGHPEPGTAKPGSIGYDC